MNDDALLKSLGLSRCIALIAHVMPDGDTLGSCLALGRILSLQGKIVDLYCQDGYPHVYSFLHGIDKFRKPEGACVEYDLCVAVDCSDLGRLGKCSIIFEHSRQTANIDHHISNTHFAGINRVESGAAATGEIIFQLFTEMGTSPDRIAAEALYTAICTDTGTFSFSSTTPRSYRIAAELLETGISVEDITSRLYRSHRPERIRLLGKALGSLELLADNQAAILKITRDMLDECGADDSDTENIINYARDIQGVELGILLKETKDGIKASFRSKERIDAASLAGHFGGGGHKRAAGASIDGDMQNAYRMILEILKKYFREP